MLKYGVYKHLKNANHAQWERSEIIKKQKKNNKKSGCWGKNTNLQCLMIKELKSKSWGLGLGEFNLSFTNIFTFIAVFPASKSATVLRVELV